MFYIYLMQSIATPCGFGLLLGYSTVKQNSRCQIEKGVGLFEKGKINAQINKSYAINKREWVEQ